MKPNNGALGWRAPLVCLALGAVSSGCSVHGAAVGSSGAGAGAATGAGSDAGGTGAGTGGAGVGTGGAGVSAGGTGGSTGGADTGTGGSGGSTTVVTTTICGTSEEEGTATLSCPAGSTITSIDFASYGTSTGACENFVEGECKAPETQAIVEAACLGKSSCTVEATNQAFGGDPCSMIVKHLDIQATCSGETGGSGGAGGSGGTGSTGPWNEGTELKAFPTAEGYGRYAKGGRGGRVIEVTNLNDSGPGSLRDAVMATGPRTVVFNVSGAIHLDSKLELKKENKDLTVAGQTAPGKGIVVHRYKFGMLGGEHVILRYIRTRVGTESGVTQDGMGITGSLGPVIYDHLSISWTIDEGFSSRVSGTSNFTLQRSMISECLNDAGHEIQQSPHGYAASIGGDIGSFHHNLTAHCAGRNWSLAGGLIHGTVTYAGRLDIRNNVFYNWKDRTTDGGAHEVNFVANYYKPGASSEIFTALNPTNDGFEGTQRYYMAGNVMPGYFDESNQEDGQNPNGKAFPYEPFVDQPFFESYVNTQTAGEAYEDVLGNVGVNVPALDDHDKRVIQEVRDGTYKYKGSRTGLPGLPDNEADVGGLENYPEETRPADWDTDHDGMPGAWETAHGLNPDDPADGNATNLSKVGYTNLEMYLNELAGDLD